MRVQTEEWRQFIPGVRMYKGKKTLFYNGEKLWNDENDGDFIVYSEEERKTWEVIIVLPGVQVIPEFTFSDCKNIETVIMADTRVKRIEYGALDDCYNLEFVRLSRNLENIESRVFYYCKSLTSIFLPSSCTEIGNEVFYCCEKLIILSIPTNIRQRIQIGRDFIAPQIGQECIGNTALIKASPFPTNWYGSYTNNDEINDWVKNQSLSSDYELDQVCYSSFPIQILFTI